MSSGVIQYKISECHLVFILICLKFKSIGNLEGETFCTRACLSSLKSQCYIDAPWLIMMWHPDKPVVGWKYYKLKMHLIHLIYQM